MIALSCLFTKQHYIVDVPAGALLGALVFGLFDFSGGGTEAATASQAAIWLGAAFAATALVVGSMRMRLQR